MTRQMFDDYLKEYISSLNSLLNEIKRNYETNLEKYSETIKGMIQDRKSMEKLGERVQQAADALEVCRKELNKIIWKGNDNV